MYHYETFGGECLQEWTENVPLSALNSSHCQDDKNVEMNAVRDPTV